MAFTSLLHGMVSTAVMAELALRAQALLQSALEAAEARRETLLLALVFALAWATLRLVVRIARFVHTYFLRPAIDPRTFGPWAVVTGATDGMGKALTHKLAEKGEFYLTLCTSPTRQ